MSRKLSCSPLAEREAGQLELPKKDSYELSRDRRQPSKDVLQMEAAFPKGRNVGTLLHSREARRTVQEEVCLDWRRKDSWMH